MTIMTKTSTGQDKLARLLEQYRDMKVESAYYLEVLKKLEKEIRVHVRETGEVAEIEGARIVVRSSKPRIKWDQQGLDRYSKSHPAILKFRSEVTYSPSVLIRVE
jgi:hypothetical protein